MALFDLHHEVVAAGVLGNIVSIMVYFAPVPTFVQIFKRKSTLEFQSLPYVVALFSSMLWIYYAFLKKNALLLISVNLVGIVIETIYIAIFLFYASKEARKHTMKIFVALNVVLFGVIFLGTFFTFKEQNYERVQVVGWICVAVSIAVFAAPLNIVFRVVRTRSVEFMPLTLSLFLTLSAVIWFLYGLLQKDLCIALPNVFGFCLGVVQMTLYVIYKNKQKAMKINDVPVEKKLPEHTVIIDMVKIIGGAAEVYPIDSQTSSSCSDEENDENITIDEETAEKKKKSDDVEDSCAPDDDHGKIASQPAGLPTTN